MVYDHRYVKKWRILHSRIAGILTQMVKAIETFALGLALSFMAKIVGLDSQKISLVAVA